MAVLGAALVLVALVAAGSALLIVGLALVGAGAFLLWLGMAQEEPPEGDDRAGR